MLRKFLSLIISLSMLTAAMPAAFAAPETEETEPETADMAETPLPEPVSYTQLAAGPGSPSPGPISGR